MTVVGLTGRVLAWAGAGAFVGVLLVSPTAAEQRVDDEVTVTFSADRTEVTRRDSVFVKRYIGDVVARMNPEVWLTAAEATYDGAGHEAVLSGGRSVQVAIVDSGRTLRADRVTYLFAKNRSAGGRPLAWLRGNVLLEDSGRAIEAALVRYAPGPDSVTAYGSVRARQPGGFLVADTLELDAKRHGMQATGSVQIVDSTDDIRIRAGWYRYERAESLGVVARNPVLTKGQGDTAVVVTADSMRLEQKHRRAAAWGKVRLERGNLVAACDSVVYDEGGNLLVLYGNPEAEQRTELDSSTTTSRLYGERVALVLEGVRVKRIEVEGAARGIASETDTAGASLGERWIFGRQIVFHIDEDRVTQVEVFGQARSRYVPTRTHREAEGINEATGDTISIAFRGGRMGTVRLRGGVQGVYWPPPDSVASRESASARSARAERGEMRRGE